MTVAAAESRPAPGPDLPAQPAVTGASGRAPGRGLFLLLAALVPTTPFPAFRLLSGAFFIPFAAAPLAAFAFWSLICRRQVADSSRTPQRCALLILALGAWSIITGLGAGHPQPSHIVSLLFYAVTSSVILAAGWVPWRTFRHASTILLVLMTPIVLAGLYQLAMGHAHWFEFIRHTSSGLGTRNSDAFMVATLFPLAFARAAVTGVRPLVRFAAGAVGVTFAAAVLLSLSRSSTVGMAVVTLGMLAAGRRLVPVRPRILLSLTALVLGTFLLLHGYYAHQELSLGRLGTVSESTRIPLAQAAAHDGLTHPLTGIGYFGFGESNPWGEDAHDGYLNFFAETGLVGLGLFACLFAVPLTAYLRALRQRGWQRAQPQVRVLCLQGFGMLLSLALLAATDTFYKSIYFWIAYIFAVLHLRLIESAVPGYEADHPAGRHHG